MVFKSRSILSFIIVHILHHRNDNSQIIKPRRGTMYPKNFTQGTFLINFNTLWRYLYMRVYHIFSKHILYKINNENTTVNALYIIFNKLAFFPLLAFLVVSQYCSQPNSSQPFQQLAFLAVSQNIVRPTYIVQYLFMTLQKSAE